VANLGFEVSAKDIVFLDGKSSFEGYCDEVFSIFLQMLNIDQDFLTHVLLGIGKSFNNGISSILTLSALLGLAQGKSRAIADFCLLFRPVACQVEQFKISESIAGQPSAF
jgi:hypothetical protein